jgi:hypothetical protein
MKKYKLEIKGYKMPFEILLADRELSTEAIHEKLLRNRRRYVVNNFMQLVLKKGFYTLTEIKND